VKPELAPQSCYRMQANHAVPKWGMVDRFRDPATRYALEFWTTEQSLIVPRSTVRVPGFESACIELGRSGWPVFERKTGGGITPHDEGTLNVSLAYALDATEQPSIHGVYDMLCSPLLALMTGLGCNATTGSVPGSFCDGAYNITVGGKKVMGTAQRWTRIRSDTSRQIVFAHAMILVDADIAAGVRAVNRFARACHLQLQVAEDKHTTIHKLVSNTRGDADQTTIAAKLGKAYLAELGALTG